jgi:hypothetical protein
LGSVVFSGAQHAGGGALGRLDSGEHDAIERENRKPNGQETEAFGRWNHHAERLAANIDRNGLEQSGLRNNVLHLKNLLAAVTPDDRLIAKL